MGGWAPAAVPGAVPYVLDYDDAVFHYSDGHRNPVVKAVLSNKHPALMLGAALVVAGNEYLAEFARQAGASAWRSWRLTKLPWRLVWCSCWRSWQIHPPQRVALQQRKNIFRSMRA